MLQKKKNGGCVWNSDGGVVWELNMTSIMCHGLSSRDSENPNLKTYQEVLEKGKLLKLWKVFPKTI